MESKKYKVLLFAGGIMGDLARNVLEMHDNVELVPMPEEAGLAPDFDILFSASYPKRIPQSWCEMARLGAVNIHTGLLPEGRGSHPLNWAIIWGRDKTGITIHKIVDSFDAGTCYAQHEIPIFESDTIVELRQRVEDAFPNMIARFFDDPESFLSRGWEQNQAHASYAQKRLPEDGQINENATPREVYNFIRAHDPINYPAFKMVDGTKVNIKSARLGMMRMGPGESKEVCYINI